MLPNCRIPIVSFLVLAACSASLAAAERPILFNRDVRPVLTDKCYACHGPDAQTVEGDLRLDMREMAVEHGAIVPGEPDASELVHRIFAVESETVMPPLEAHKPLSQDERELLRRWIAEGAPYEAHWAYTPLRRNDPSEDSSQDGPAAIDRFIERRLVAAVVKPTPEADRTTLIRRLSFDLAGVPPMPEEVDDFVNDPADEAYEKLVDRLLQSDRYGERMAIYWLDLVRYADTVGYHGDQDVSQSPYRDYVINAFNKNMPYDQFVREQLAGDLLPDATIDQRVASGYNRLNQTTEEGGAQAKEYLAIYFADRVRNVSQVFMGATMGCAQCHDHKYDPYTTRDFYSLGAFFADLEEKGVYGARLREPTIRVPSDAQQKELAALDHRISELSAKRRQLRDDLLVEQAYWEAAAREHGDESAEVAAALALGVDERSVEQAELVRQCYLSKSEPMVALNKRIATAEANRKNVEESAPLTVVSKSVKPRPIRILPRGNWMDDSGDIVEPAIPEFLGDLETGGDRPTRLDLANWLCEPDNMLTSRTMVNRLWYLLFGRGICTSVDDLGGQGAFPSHPELLDWLALEFVQSGWNVKHMIRTIALCKSYRRSSKPTPDLREQDPYNYLFARQGRFPLAAEMIRDGALAISGLLVERIGGVSAKPYQPAGYYAELNFPKRTYSADHGDDQYRRGVYTHWQRTFLHPMLKAFDAPSREECSARRAPSNTPVQALTLLNDPTFVEAARVFAARIMREGGTARNARIAWAYGAAMSHVPNEAIVAELKSVYDRHLAQFRQHPEAAKQLTSVGLAPVEADLDPAELAAWTSVARVILNLHEAITRY